MKREFTTIEKPPIGLVPKEVRLKERLQEVREAIVRYYNADREIPLDWVTEYNDLIKQEIK